MKVWVVSGYDLNWKFLVKPAVFKNKEEAEAWYYNLSNEMDGLIKYGLDEVELKETE